MAHSDNEIPAFTRQHDPQAMQIIHTKDLSSLKRRIVIDRQ